MPPHRADARRPHLQVTVRVAVAGPCRVGYLRRADAVVRGVLVRLISERTVEENILKKANQKRMLGDMAIEGGNFTTAFFKQVRPFLRARVREPRCA